MKVSLDFSVKHASHDFQTITTPAHIIQNLEHVQRRPCFAHYCDPVSVLKI